MQEKLNVVFTIDMDYVQHFCVACTSLLENNKKIINRIFLVHDIEQNNTKFKKAIEFLEDKYNVKIEQLKLEDTSILDNFKLTHHVSKATYFRLLLSEIIPGDIDRVLFLDSDIIVNGSLVDLLTLDFFRSDNLDIRYKDGIKDNEYYILAVDHKYNEQALKRLKEIGFRGNKYFNGGVMLINLKKWREDNIAKILIENAKKYNKHLVCWDQDVLNITFDMRWGELDFKYNAFGLVRKSDSQDYRIIHYTGSSKPWHFRNNHPYKHLYWQYLKITPFKRYIPEDLTVWNVIKWMIPKNIKEFLKRIHHKKSD